MTILDGVAIVNRGCSGALRTLTDMPRHIKLELDNLITAAIILEDVEGCGGEESGRVRWARMILQNEQEKQSAKDA